MGSIKEKLQQKLQQYKQNRTEREAFDQQLAIERKREYRIGYAKGTIARAREEGYAAAKQKGGGTLGKAWKITQRVGEGFIGTAEAIYPEYAGKRTPHRTVKRKKKSKRDPLDLLGW